MRRKSCMAVYVCAIITTLLLFPCVARAEESLRTIYRLYNPNSGEHLYTSDQMERDAIVDLGWNYEGIGWYAPEESSVPVYRVYNPYAGDHHYTSDGAERDSIVALGWNDEGIGWYSDENERVPVWRQYNPNAITGTHNYTTSKEENDSLASIGWHAEGIGWYAAAMGKPLPNLASPSETGALHVKGTKLVGKDGSAVQLRGVSTHGLAWFPSYVNDACFKDLRQKWNANVVRLAMYTAEYGGYCTGGNQEELRALVKRGVDYARDNDLYAIVDWHILNDNNPLTHVNEAKDFFSRMSKQLASYDNVLYEICNEPNGNTSWQDVKRYAEQIIPVIRANDNDAVVLVGTPTWSQDIHKVAADPLTFDNVMYTLHFYAATHGSWLRDRMTDALDNGLPVFVSEFGICDASGNGQIDEAAANQWLDTMNRRKVSWCMWSLCNKDESASILTSSCAKSSGFTQADLSQSGRWLLRSLKASPLSDDGTDTSGNEDDGSGNTDGPSVQPDPQSITFTSGSMNCTITPAGSWQDGGKTCYQFELSFINNGKDCDSWCIQIPFNKPIEFINGWNGAFEISGNTLTVRNAEYNGSVARGQTLTGVGFQVKGPAGLIVNP